MTYRYRSCPLRLKVLTELSGALLSLEYSCGTFLQHRQSAAISEQRGSYFVPLDMPEVWVRSAVVRSVREVGGTDGSLAGSNTCRPALPLLTLDTNRGSSIATVP